ncbi:MAG: SRPBCC family protein [Planctomycetes bacterium]|nr:SRPBCC family protein [Planctomycetota bacterium]
MPTISRHESLPRTYTLRDEQWLPRGIEEVFEFFADACRLEEITPPWLHFQVQTPKPVPMHAGSLIDYTLKLHGVPIRWRTEISEWAPPFRFVDCQLKGPYRLWRHLHTFEERDGGTFVRDHVDYRVPGGPLVHWLFVRPDLNRIFTYRRQTLQKLLGRSTAPTVTE